MAKKKEIVSENTTKDTIERYEKLRDELFHYRVEIQAYKRSMGMLWTCVSIVVALLGFFGYNRVEALLSRVEQTANERLAKSDALLAQVDTYSVDSLALIIQEKVQVLEVAITALENGTRVNNVLYKKLIAGLPYNKMVDLPFEKIKVNVSGVTDEFDVVYYSERYTVGELGECYIIMGEDYFKERDDVLLVQVFPLNWFIPVYSQSFEVNSDYNRLCFEFSPLEQHKDYEIAITLLRKQDNHTVGYRINKPVFIN